MGRIVANINKSRMSYLVVDDDCVRFDVPIGTSHRTRYNHLLELKYLVQTLRAPHIIDFSQRLTLRIAGYRFERAHLASVSRHIKTYPFDRSALTVVLDQRGDC